MKIEEYADWVDEVWSVPLDKELPVIALGLAGESGEVIDIIKKSMVKSEQPDRDHLKEEMGDAIYYWVKLANYYGFDIEDILDANHEKLTKRYGDKYGQQSDTGSKLFGTNDSGD